MTFKRLPQYLKLCKREREKIEHFTPTYCKLIICPWNHEKCQSMFMFLPIYNVNLRLCSPCVTNNEHCLFIEFMTRLVVRSICIERAKIFLQFHKLLINAKNHPKAEMNIWSCQRRFRSLSIHNDIIASLFLLLGLQTMKTFTLTYCKHLSVEQWQMSKHV